MKNKMNLETLSWAALEKLNQLDRSFVGTEDYMGLAYFWNHEYKHYLRDASITQKRRVHNHFLKNGLALAGESDEHERIVKRFVKTLKEESKETEEEKWDKIKEGFKKDREEREAHYKECNGCAYCD